MPTPACTMTRPRWRASALTSDGSRVCIAVLNCSSPVATGFDRSRDGVRSFSSPSTRRSSIARATSNVPRTKANAATSARSATAVTRLDEHHDAEPRQHDPLIAISTVRVPLVGSANAVTSSVTPSAIAQIAIA